MKVELSDVPMTAALVKRHEAETAAIPMNPPPLLLMQHATRQAIELLEHAAFLERRCAPPEALQNADTARLDALEKDVNERGPLLLHNLRVTGNFRGLGLASTGRSLRKAIDDMAPHAVSVPSPQLRSQEKP